MNPSDTFHLDEHLARLLAAYDPGMDGGDARLPTINIPQHEPLPGERAVAPLSGNVANEGSVQELLPDPSNTRSLRAGQPPVPAPTSAPGPSAGPHRVGRFELRRQLGKGGCGIVFLAYDPKLEREVALKIPRPEMLLSQDARRRLIREALAAAEFDHPNLVPVYETGEIGPVCFIATAFCPGITLGEWLDRQAFPVPVRQAARLVTTLAEAVQHAHDRGVLHRDLKPNNIILQGTKDDPNETEPPPGSCQLRGESFIPRIVDFGLAKLLERGGPSETTTRQILGTPKYMAPEQAQARHDDVGPTADVYALGVILYEMLTGRAPYEGATDVEVLRLAIDGDLTRPRQLRSDLPRDLEAICLKAMARSPAKRYRTAIDFTDDLRRFLEGKPTIARPLKWAGRAARWLRRNDQVVALTVVTTVATVLLAVGSWSLMQNRQFKTDRDVALKNQADRTRGDQQRDYAAAVRGAFLAWRVGDVKAATEYIDTARRLSRVGGEAPGFALEYLARQVATERLMIVCPAGAITALAVSRDGNRLASGHADGTIAVWDRATGEQLASADSGSWSVPRLAFALDGTRLLSANGNGLDCWTVAPNGTLTRIAEPKDATRGNVECFAVTADGKTIYAGNHRGAVYRIAAATLTVPPPVSLTPGDAITAVSVSPSGKCVLFGTRGGKLIRCNADLRPTEGELDVKAQVSAVACLSDDGTSFAVGFVNGDMQTFPGGVVQRLAFPQVAPPISWLTRTEGGLAANGLSGQVRLGPQAGHILPTGDLEPLRAGVASADGKTLFAGSDDGIIRAWHLPADLRQLGTRNVNRQAGGSVVAVGVHPDGARVAVGTSEGVTDHEGTANEIRIRTLDRPPLAVRILKEGPAVAAYLDERAALVREVRHAAAPVRFALPDDASPVSADLSADASRLVVGDDRGRVFVWNVLNRTLLTQIDTGHRRPIGRVVISDDGTTIAATVQDGVAVWTVGEAKPMCTVLADENTTFRLAPGGDRLATASRSGVVRVYTVYGGREELTLHGHVGRVTALGVSPDGRTLVSGGATGEVKFWDLRTGTELIGLRRHNGPVKVIEFSQNGKLLVTAGVQLATWETNKE